MMNRMLAAIRPLVLTMVFCGTGVFTACSSNDDDNEQTDPKLAEKIIGKWLYFESDGELVETAESSVTTFVMEGSTLKAYISQSLKDYGLWVHNQPAEVTMNGNKMTLTMKAGDLTTVEEFTDITVSGDDLRYTSKYTILRNGKVIVTMGPYRLRCTKVYDDYSKIFIGRWEGIITSNEPGYTPQPFCEHYFANGTNIEYELVEGQWVEVEAEYAEFFIDGNLLCTRWKYPGQDEQCENSIFESYVDGTLIVKEVVLRNGHLYTETTTLTKTEN